MHDFCFLVYILIGVQHLELLNEKNIYANHYDKDPTKGNPRDGWVRVGLIDDLSIFISVDSKATAKQLKHTWAKHWKKISEDRNVTDTLIKEIDEIRSATREVLKELY